MIKLLVGVLAVLAFFVLNKSDRLPDIRLQVQNTNLQQDEYRYVQEKCASDKCWVIYVLLARRLLLRSLLYLKN